MSDLTVRHVSTHHKIAAAISVAFSVLGIAWSIPVLQGGAAQSDQVPYPIVVIGFAFSIVQIVAAYGVWRGQRWGVVTTIVLNALSFISGAPGILFGPSAFLVVSSIVGCVANVVVIALLLRRGHRTSSTTADDSAAARHGVRA